MFLPPPHIFFRKQLLVPFSITSQQTYAKSGKPIYVLIVCIIRPLSRCSRPEYPINFDPSLRISFTDNIFCENTQKCQGHASGLDYVVGVKSFRVRFWFIGALYKILRDFWHQKFSCFYLCFFCFQHQRKICYTREHVI